MVSEGGGGGNDDGGDAASNLDAGSEAASDAGAAFTLSSPTNGTLTFGNVLCPAGNLATPTVLVPAASQTVTFQNTGSAPLDWSASVTTPYYTLSALSDAGASASTQNGTLAAGASQTLIVVPSAILWPANTAANAYGDTLTITTDAPNDSPHVIALTETAQGAVLSTNVATGFGTVYLGTTGVLTPAFTLQNNGNGATNVTVTPAVTAASGASPTFALETGSSTIVTSATPIALAAASSASLNATFTPGPLSTPANAATSSVVDTFTTDGSPLCAPLPTAISLSGTGTVALATYSPSSLNFQNVPCGTTAASQTITFSNFGNTTYTVTNLAIGTSFYAQPTMSPTSGIVPAAVGSTPGTLTITVTPVAIPALVPSPGTTTYDDTLTVTYVTGPTGSTTTTRRPSRR